MTVATKKNARLQSPAVWKDHRGVDLISDVLPFRCACWYSEPDAISNAMTYAKLYSRSHDAVIHVYDETGNVTETHDHKDEFKERLCLAPRV